MDAEHSCTSPTCPICFPELSLEAEHSCNSPTCTTCNVAELVTSPPPSPPWPAYSLSPNPPSVISSLRSLRLNHAPPPSIPHGPLTAALLSFSNDNSATSPGTLDYESITDQLLRANKDATTKRKTPICFTDSCSRPRDSASLWCSSCDNLD